MGVVTETFSDFRSLDPVRNLNLNLKILILEFDSAAVILPLSNDA